MKTLFLRGLLIVSVVAAALCFVKATIEAASRPGSCAQGIRR